MKTMCLHCGRVARSMRRSPAVPEPMPQCTCGSIDTFKIEDGVAYVKMEEVIKPTVLRCGFCAKSLWSERDVSEFCQCLTRMAGRSFGMWSLSRTECPKDVVMVAMEVVA